eukprot:6491557-Amphidinium_carterae.1
MACANVLNAVVLQLGPATPWRDVAVKRIALCAGRCICFRRSWSLCSRDKTCRNMFHGSVKGRLAANHLGSGCLACLLWGLLDGRTQSLCRLMFRVLSRAVLRVVRVGWVSAGILWVVRQGCRSQRKSSGCAVRFVSVSIEQLVEGLFDGCTDGFGRLVTEASVSGLLEGRT